MREFYSAKEIAQVLEKTERAVQIRANRESWPYRTETGRGGKRKLYGPVYELPPDIQVAIVKSAVASGTPPLPSQVPLLCPLAQAKAIAASGGNGMAPMPKGNGTSPKQVGVNPAPTAPHGLTAPEKAVSPKVLADSKSGRENPRRAGSPLLPAGLEEAGLDRSRSHEARRLVSDLI